MQPVDFKLVIGSHPTGITLSDQPSASPGPKLAVASNPSLGWVQFNLVGPVAASTRLDIFGPDGSLVRSLAIGPVCRSLVWDCVNRQGQPVPGGVYFARLGSNGRPGTRFVLLH